jgi:DNA (cytosine-5)-methyltransferase 1
MLTSVELFAGAGGLGMGLTQAGFRHLAVVELNQWACDTIRRNQALGHPLVAGWPLFQGDVRAFDYDAIRGPVDVVAGGPPCQPFSLGGKHRAFDDARDMFPAIADVVRRLRPRAFIVENVRGLIRPAFAEYFDYVLARLTFPDIERAAGEAWIDHARRLRRQRSSGRRTGLTYDVSFRLLNAADYGVPQRRERVFIVGFRDDLGIGHHAAGSQRFDWSFPNSTHSRDASPAWRPSADGPARTSPWRTVRDALRGLPDPEFEPGAARRFPDHAFQPGVRFYPGHTGSSLDLPAKTLKAGDHGVPGGENALLRADGSGRYFTVRESARLQTFPDDYVFGGSWSEVMRQLGNAVPVALARAVGEAVARTLVAPTLVAPTLAAPTLAAPGLVARGAAALA